MAGTDFWGPIVHLAREPPRTLLLRDGHESPHIFDNTCRAPFPSRVTIQNKFPFMKLLYEPEICQAGYSVSTPFWNVSLCLDCGVFVWRQSKHFTATKLFKGCLLRGPGLNTALRRGLNPYKIGGVITWPYIHAAYLFSSPRTPPIHAEQVINAHPQVVFTYFLINRGKVSCPGCMLIKEIFFSPHVQNHTYPPLTVTFWVLAHSFLTLHF